MKLKKNAGGLLIGLFLGALGFVSSASADGMLVAPSSSRVSETDQKAVIFYEDGMEDLFISISFSGNAKDFGWIVPTPAEPEVTKSTDMLFTNLDKMTRPEYPQASTSRGGWDNAKLEQAMDSGVQVLQTKKIEYYDISVIKASNKDDLYNWLNDNGYQFPQAGKYIVDEYIENNWAFTAIKLDANKMALGSRQFQTGHAIPLKLSFKTDQVVYPMKISSINGMDDNAPEGEITYITGAQGKGMMLDQDRLVATDQVIEDFDINNGKVAFNLKKRSDSVVGEILRIEQAKAYLGLHQGVIINNRQKNSFTIDLWRNGGSHQQAKVDLGSDFKENEWQKFEFSWKKSATSSRELEISFSIDGTERTLVSKSYGLTSLRSNEINDKAKLLIGGYEQYVDQTGDVSRYRVEREKVSGDVSFMPSEPQINYRTSRSSDILIDEILINSNEEVVFKASFENDLSVTLANEAQNKIRVFANSGIRTINGSLPKSMGILIYIFSDKKYEIPGFDVQYAGQLDKQSIENIAKIDGKTPWISPKKNKYFLTRVYKEMEMAQMTEDIYPQLSEDQDSFNYAGGDNNRIIFLVTLLIISFGSVAVMIFKIIQNEKKAKK